MYYKKGGVLIYLPKHFLSLSIMMYPMMNEILDSVKYSVSQDICINGKLALEGNLLLLLFSGPVVPDSL